METKENDESEEVMMIDTVKGQEVMVSNDREVMVVAKDPEAMVASLIEVMAAEEILVVEEVEEGVVSVGEEGGVILAAVEEGDSVVVVVEAEGMMIFLVVFSERMIFFLFLDRGKKSMSDVDSLMQLVRSSPDMSDSACLRIIDPTPEDVQGRENFIENVETNIKSKYFMPPCEPWRVATRLGLTIDNNQHIIRSNCFRVNPQFLPPKIFNYHIGIFRVDKEGNLGKEDLAKDSRDVNQNIGVVKAAVEMHPDWKVDRKMSPVGFSYDGHSSMYTSSLLPILFEAERSTSTYTSTSSSDSDGYTVEVAWPAESSSIYVVVIRLVSEVVIPRTHGTICIFSYFSLFY